jgi:hypothetical protein
MYYTCAAITGRTEKKDIILIISTLKNKVNLIFINLSTLF